ncbi:MAG: 2Fe-2S iron-sulfur cluster-binding protein [Proteobacteria bacterium]|nr:2Fe-2S iron-sulfur cluster-binding protein [Pseudomonadota bacterium]
MTEIVLNIDGREVKATAGMTVLQAAQKEGIHIPTLCHHEKLEAFGGCRLCMVEVESRGWTSYVVSCLYPVAKDIVVRTRSEKVDKIRKVLVEELMAHAPDAPELIKLAEEYGADRNRFEKEASFCILCGLCVRYCNEVKQKNAVSFFDNGSVREIKFVPEVAKEACWDCQECFTICPTSYAQAAYLLTEALAFPGQRKTAVQAAPPPELKPRVIPIMPVPMTA